MSKLKKTGFPAAVVLGLAGALLLTALLLLPFAMAIQREAVSKDWGWLCAVVSAGVSICIATVFVSRIRGRQVLATGGTIALGYVVLAVLLCITGGGRTSFGIWLVRLAAGAFAGALTGAVLSVRQNAHRKNRGKRI